MADKFNFQAPQYAELRSIEEELDTFFKENEDPLRTQNVLKSGCFSTPKDRPHRALSTSVVSRSGRRCHGFRDSSCLREKELFNRRLFTQGTEREWKFRARPASILNKEPFYFIPPSRHSRYLIESSKQPKLETEMRAKHRKLLREKHEMDKKRLEAEEALYKKIKEEELRKFRKTLEFKATKRIGKS